MLQAVNVEAAPDIDGDLVQQHPVFSNVNVGVFHGVLIPLSLILIYGFGSDFATRYIIALAITCGCGPLGATHALLLWLAPQSRLTVVGSALMGPLMLATILSDTYLFVAGTFCVVLPVASSLAFFACVAEQARSLGKKRGVFCSFWQRPYCKKCIEKCGRVQEHWLMKRTCLSTPAFYTLQHSLASYP